jgi:hypothetical protein
MRKRYLQCLLWLMAGLAGMVAVPARAAGELPLLTVQQVEVLGSGVFSAEELHALVRDAEGKRLDLPALQALAQRVTDFYRQHQRNNIYAVIPPQDFQRGVVRLRVVKAASAEALAAVEQVTESQFAVAAEAAANAQASAERGFIKARSPAAAKGETGISAGNNVAEAFRKAGVHTCASRVD